jgi:hypothetical protein
MLIWKFLAATDTLLQKANNMNLQFLCQSHGIDQFINLNPSSRGVISTVTMSDAMEAIFGAVAEDGGQEALRTVMLNLGML